MAGKNKSIKKIKSFDLSKTYKHCSKLFFTKKSLLQHLLDKHIDETKE